MELQEKIDAWLEEVEKLLQEVELDETESEEKWQKINY